MCVQGLHHTGREAFLLDVRHGEVRALQHIVQGTQHLFLEVMTAHHHAHHVQDVRLAETVHLPLVHLGRQADRGLQQMVHGRGASWINSMRRSKALGSLVITLQSVSSFTSLAHGRSSLTPSPRTVLPTSAPRR